MKKHKKRKKGFTLIELMVTITIIGILATVGMVTYSNAQKSARDARRKDDLKQIAVALELYYQHNNYYPRDTSNEYGLYDSIDNTSDPWITELGSQYITAMPRDPQNIAPYYAYVYVPFNCTSSLTNCQSYSLFDKLENGNDPQAIYHGVYDFDTLGYTDQGCMPAGSFVISSNGQPLQDASRCP